MKKPYRILIAEDHRILREGLRSLLSSNADFEIAGEAENGIDAIRCVGKIMPDLVLIDLSMPKMGGLDAISEIKKLSPDVKILVLTVHKAEEYVFESLKAGADGYLLKDSTHTELKLAIESTMNGRPYISPGISETLVAGYLKAREHTPKNKNIPKAGLKSTKWESLTKRERQVMKLIAEGNRNKDIANDLCISVKTVEKHRSNLMKKLDIHNISGLTALAMEKGIVAV
ncbi:response regulator transcription factor [Desulfobacterales bacterium HSG16]|nr:response regulator transcription factor [Desulfobacterales bacterium HSG16]